MSDYEILSLALGVLEISVMLVIEIIRSTKK